MIIPEGKDINHKTNIDKNWPNPDILFAQKDVTELTEPSLLKSEVFESLSTMSGTIDSLEIKLTYANVLVKSIFIPRKTNKLLLPISGEKPAT